MSLEKLMTLAHQKKFLQYRDVAAEGISRSVLRKAVRNGKLIQVSRGLYIRPDMEFGEKLDFAVVSKRAPHSVICLISALRFHNLTTQLPTSIWIATAKSGYEPKLDYPPFKTVKLSQEDLEIGVERYEVESVPVKVFSVARTVIDCFRFRDLVGEDVAIEALEEVLRENLCPEETLSQLAREIHLASDFTEFMEKIKRGF